MSEIQQFSMDDVQKRIAETMKAQFAMLLPDEVFAQMTEAAIKEFFETEMQFRVVEKGRHINDGSYHGRTVRENFVEHAMTPFKIMLWEQVRGLTEVALKKWAEDRRITLDAEIKGFFNKGGEFDKEGTMNVEKLAKSMASSMQLSLLSQAGNQVFNAMSQFASLNQLHMIQG